jgi:hypothetical protein
MIRPAVGTLAVLLLAGCASSTAGASCVGPQMTVTPTTVAAGDSVQVEGQWFFDDCYDGGQPGNPPATQDVDLRLVTSGAAARTFVLTTVDADDDGEVHTTVAIPDDVPAGPARIESGIGRPADVVVGAP